MRELGKKLGFHLLEAESCLLDLLDLAALDLLVVHEALCALERGVLPADYVVIRPDDVSNERDVNVLALGKVFEFLEDALGDLNLLFEELVALC